jgi:hypothetical protein
MRTGNPPASLPVPTTLLDDAGPGPKVADAPLALEQRG